MKTVVVVIFLSLLLVTGAPAVDLAVGEIIVCGFGLRFFEVPTSSEFVSVTLAPATPCLLSNRAMAVFYLYDPTIDGLEIRPVLVLRLGEPFDSEVFEFTGSVFLNSFGSNSAHVFVGSALGF